MNTSILHSTFCILHSMGGAPLIPKLRGYFAEFLREVSLARLSLFDSPTCVGLRYGRPWEHYGAFLGVRFKESASTVVSTSACATATFSRQPFSSDTSLYHLTIAGAGILNLLSIVYALRPRLRSRLTLGGRTLPRKPWVYGGQGSHLAYRYSCLHPHL